MEDSGGGGGPGGWSGGGERDLEAMQDMIEQKWREVGVFSSYLICLFLFIHKCIIFCVYVFLMSLICLCVCI